ncbi:hypothetical protein CYMTET_9961 [Cymbomonas tetramitiformis]|uniref:Phosphatidic acid phosphatase type 2/haloperoxidase domain-containing protein n=1 Tax=Cymbomonas tetramitiformis TaxID=36881 RepID=A0AAE0GQ08_9CHLO|nr:hypothetical protein CYMTET_9961 [Cymbomonas tetramitiformis]
MDTKGSDKHRSAGGKGTTVLLREMSPRASFPSGDVAGAAVFAGVCWTVTGSPGYLVAIAVSAFGRMYFHAHHFLDILVGGLVGLAGTCFIGWCQAWVIFGWMHLLFSQVFFVAGYGLGSHLQKLQKKMKPV